jgi:hypothetical protein
VITPGTRDVNLARVLSVGVADTWTVFLVVFLRATFDESPVNGTVGSLAAV